MELKQVILVRTDLKMDKGKLAVQCSHAAVECALKSDDEKLKAWKRQGVKKIVLKVPSLKALYKYKALAKLQGLKTALITDAGKTFFKVPTTSCLGIGPDDEEKIDSITGDLKML
ncbi:MAG: peptidyl-tRNA hydrolase Pth2 [archaeon]